MLLILFGLIFCTDNPPAIRIPVLKNKQSISSNVPFRQTHTDEIAINDSRCLQGGLRISTWIDQQINDDIYTEGVDSDYAEKVICFKNLATSTPILTKPGDFKIIATDIATNDTDCPQGGKRYESFIDVDGNSLYDSTIDTQYNYKKICTGLSGTASLSGSNGGIVATVLTTGDAQCPTGGFKVDLFTDVNGNGTYESTIDTFHSVRYICHGSPSVTINSTVPLNDSTCLNGGTQINTFTDMNNNGTYESTIDTNSRIYKICHGQKALALTTTLTSGDTTCAAGGTQLTTCVDSNGDNTCTSGTDLNYATQKICNGPGAGFILTYENPGANCKAGGYRSERFQDNNNNAIYDLGTDTGYSSTYICNGLNWLSRSTSFTSGNGTAADNTACLTGGVRFEFGYDHVNSSNGAYFVGTDGVLDTIEIVSTATAYSCNGSNGVAGPFISKFQNDSEGTNARFYWEMISADGAQPNVKLAYASTKAAIQAWNCESSLAGVTVVTDFSSCTDTTYRTAASGSLNSFSKCGFDLTSAPFSTAPWDYRYFKVCAQNSTSPNTQTLSSFRVAGNVPSGMVMVHLDDWPVHEFSNTSINPYTYAIDKWEPYLSGGAITNGVPGGCTNTSCVSASTGILDSSSGQTPSVSMDWYASRQGCANRINAAYTGVSTSRTIHMQTELEQFVANYGTPDEYISAYGNQITGNTVNVITSGYQGCNIDLKHNSLDNTYNGNEFYLTGDISTQNCISRYGARDLIGNFSEYNDGYYDNLNNNTTRIKSIYWGTSDIVSTNIDDTTLGYLFPITGGLQRYLIRDWDYQNLLPQTYTLGGIPSLKFFGDEFVLDSSTATKVAINGYGSWSYGSYLGRFEKDLSRDATTSDVSLSTRCAILSP